MFSKCQGRLAHHDRHAEMNQMRMRRYGFRPSGNSAFDSYKADTLADIRAASETLAALIGVEMELHVDYCAGWGLDPIYYGSRRIERADFDRVSTTRPVSTRFDRRSASIT